MNLSHQKITLPRSCAFCGKSTALTREHIWPSGIIRRVPEYTARYSEKADKVFGADLTIADVCAKCNNGPLSDLDAYICDLYDRYFAFFPERGEAVEFSYDSSRLGRWLLKISYNSARASGPDGPALSRSADLILGTDPRPPDVAIWLDLVAPAYFENLRDGIAIEPKRVPPKMTRVCRVQIPGAETPNYLVRMVAINAFYFYLAVPVTPYSGVFDDLKCIVEFFGLFSYLEPDKSVVLAKTTGLDADMLISPHLHAKSNLYNSHFNRRRAKKK